MMYQAVSDRGAFICAASEALVPTRYKDMVGIDTWGIGHTHMAGMPDPRQMSFLMPKNLRPVYLEAWDVFLADLRSYSDDVVRKFGKNLLQHELDGLTSWHFNTGGANKSRATKLWKAGDKAGAVSALKSWNKVTIKGVKQVSEALRKRREDEARLILTGEYPADRLAVYGTDGAGKIIWKPLETFSFGQWAEVLGAGPQPQKVSGLADLLKNLWKGK